MQFTTEIYKRDRRLKAGERCVGKLEYDRQDRAAMDREVRELTPLYPAAKGYRIEVHATFVTRRNAMTGVEYQERYDTAYSCSPASESYWSE